MTTYVNQSKNTSTFTNQPKNTATFSFQSKTANAVDYLLKEDAFYLLLEDGGKIVLDGSVGGWGYQTKN